MWQKKDKKHGQQYATLYIAIFLGQQYLTRYTAIYKLLCSVYNIVV